MIFPRRRFLTLAAGAAAMPALSHVARAQNYPTRVVRIVVGFTVGGLYDTYARLIAQWLSEQLGQPFVIENRIGAGGSIATESVVRAPPDGYTLLFTGSNDAWNTALYDHLNFNYIRDIVPVAGIASARNCQPGYLAEPGCARSDQLRRVGPPRHLTWRSASLPPCHRPSHPTRVPGPLPALPGLGHRQRRHGRLRRPHVARGRRWAVGWPRPAIVDLAAGGVGLGRRQDIPRDDLFPERRRQRPVANPAAACHGKLRHGAGSPVGSGSRATLKDRQPGLNSVRGGAPSREAPSGLLTRAGRIVYLDVHLSGTESSLQYNL